MSALGIEPDIGLRELLEIAVSSDWSIQFSPMLRGPGGNQGGTFIRRAAPWKGLTKSDDESFSEYKSRLSAVSPGVASGLEKARQMALDVAEGSSGVALVKRNGEVFPVPAGAAALMEAGSKPVEILGQFQSVNSAIDRMITITGERPALPSVY